MKKMFQVEIYHLLRIRNIHVHTRRAAKMRPVAHNPDYNIFSIGKKWHFHFSWLSHIYFNLPFTTRKKQRLMYIKSHFNNSILITALFLKIWYMYLVLHNPKQHKDRSSQKQNAT